jgi:hypothetical protein
VKTSAKTLLCVLVSLLPASGSARIGETLERCEQRYGPGTELPVDDKLKSVGVKAYRFQPSPLVVVAIIGDQEGVMRISYFAQGKFSPQVLISLMRRNSPNLDEPRPWARPPGEQRDSSFLYGQGITRGIPVDESTPRWSIGPAGDPASLTAALTKETFYSQLSVVSYLKEERQKRAAGLKVNISSRAEDLLARLYGTLEKSADASAANQFVGQFIDDPTSRADELEVSNSPRGDGDTSWSLDPTRHPNLSFTNAVGYNNGTRIDLRNGTLIEHQSVEDAGRHLDNHLFWLKGKLEKSNGSFEVSWGYEGGGGDNAAVVQMTGPENERIGRAITKKGHPVLFSIAPSKVSMSWGPRVEGSGERALTVSWPRDEQTSLEDEPAASATPKGIPVPGKPGFVRSPFDSEGRFIDVRGLPSGTEVRDPYTDQAFVTP